MVFSLSCADINHEHGIAVHSRNPGPGTSCCDPVQVHICQLLLPHEVQEAHDRLKLQALQLQALRFELLLEPLHCRIIPHLACKQSSLGQPLLLFRLPRQQRLDERHQQDEAVRVVPTACNLRQFNH